MAEQAQKLAFTQYVQNLANQLAELADNWNDAFNVQTARNWHTGGSDPIVDLDIADSGITAAELNSFLSTLRTRFVSLMSGQTVSGVVNGRSVTDAIRSDI